MLVAGSTRAAVAGDHVKVTPRRVWPRILDIGRQRDGAALAQLGALNVNLEDFQERSDARVVHRSRVGRNHYVCPRLRMMRLLDQISTTASMVTRAGAKAPASAANCVRSQKPGIMVCARTVRASATVSDSRGWTFQRIRCARPFCAKRSAGVFGLM